ncbi:hypothetical protein D3C72_2272270 [compost metagenome]
MAKLFNSAITERLASAIQAFSSLPVLVSINSRNFFTNDIVRFNSADDWHSLDISFFCVLLILLSGAKNAMAAADGLKKEPACCGIFVCRAFFPTLIS